MLLTLDPSKHMQKNQSRNNNDSVSIFHLDSTFDFILNARSSLRGHSDLSTMSRVTHSNLGRRGSFLDPDAFGEHSIRSQRLAKSYVRRLPRAEAVDHDAGDYF